MLAIEKIEINHLDIWSVLVGAGWYKGDLAYYRVHNFYGEYASFSGELILRYEDGSEEAICTGREFQGADSAILFSDIYDGEIYDARLEESIQNEKGSRETKAIQVV